MNVSKRKSVVFLISDFLDSKYWKSLKLVNKKHDLIGIRISDPAEKSIPNIGLFKGYDPESGDEFWIDTSSNKERKLLRRSISEKWDDFDKKCKKNKFSLLTVSTSEDYVEPIMNFFIVERGGHSP